MSGPMTPATRLDLDVSVWADGGWYPGVLEHWRRRHDRWEGWGALVHRPRADPPRLVSR